MTIHKENLKTVQDIMKLVTGNITKKTFVDSFNNVVAHVLKAEKNLEERMDNRTEAELVKLRSLEGEFRGSLSDIQKEADVSISSIRGKIRDSIDSFFIKSALKRKFSELLSRLDVRERGLNELVASVEAKIAEVKDGNDADEDLIVEKVLARVPETEKFLHPDATIHRDELEKLEGDERLDKSAVKGLDEALEEIRKSSSQKGGGGGVVGRDLITDIDLSADLDGSTKTFQIHAVHNIISVHLSSFPHALRKTVDFTYTPTSITFTSEIDAGSSLAEGQTCVLTVVSG